VHARNQADSTVHTVRKALAEHGDKISADEKSKIEALAAATEEVMKGSDTAAITAKTAELAQASQKLGEQMYAQAGAGAQGGGAQAEAGGKKADDADVVDAEFEEVKDKKG
jgi:molecular chaperone DnaK